MDIPILVHFSVDVNGAELNDILCPNAQFFDNNTLTCNPSPRPSNQWQLHLSAPTNPWQPHLSTAWHPQAHVANSDASTSSNWLLDSGASHHITAGLKNLSFHKPYDGTNDIVIGEGTSLSISHTGSTTFSTPSHKFTLPNVLCVPTMKRNLISIS